MSTCILGIDLRDAARSGAYPCTGDELDTLAADARRAGLLARRIDLRGCRDKHDLLARLAAALALPAHFGRNWDALADSLRDLAWLPAPGYALLFGHAVDLRRNAPADFAVLRELLAGAAAGWAARGVPFFAFLEWPDRETLDAAIDA
jgi:RNAse (barnase) inhibitor barstar